MSWRDSRDEDLDRELRSHLEAEALERQEQGLSPVDARNAARRALGNSGLIKENVRDAWGWTALEQVLRDARFGLRAMRKNPGFTAVAVLSLAIGIGAATSVFSILNAVLLRPLPVSEPARLVVLRSNLRGDRFVFFNPSFEKLRGSQKSLTGMFAVSDNRFTRAVIGNEPPSFVRASKVSGSYFSTFGLKPAMGRLLVETDDHPSAPCAAVLSHSFWVERFQASPEALGRAIAVGEKSCSIAGVAPASYRGHVVGYEPQVWFPIAQLTSPRLLASESMAFFSGVMGRLRPGLAPGQAESELTALYQRIMSTVPPEAHRPGEQPPKATDFSVSVLPGAQGLDDPRRRFERPLGIVLAVAGVVLLIAVVNVANLLIARGAARDAELSTRAALGAGRPRLITQLAIEGGLLALGGGVLGCLLAYFAAPALAALPSMPSGLDVSPDLRVLGAALSATILAALLAGIIPALRLSRASLQSRFAGAGRATPGGARQRLTRTLVAAQLALSLLLVTSTALLLRSILHVMSVDPGFNARHAILMDISDTSPSAGFGEFDSPSALASRAALYRSLDARLNAIPGVQSAGLSWLGLFGGNHVGLNVYDVELPRDGKFTLCDYVTPGYFDAVGMSLLRGRLFTDADREGALRVAIVNEAFVRERVPGDAEAIGRNLVMTYDNDRRPFTIAGIVRDAKYNDLREPKTDPMIWVPIAQFPAKISSISLRVTPGNEAAAVQQVRAALAATSGSLMTRQTVTLRERVDGATARERLLLTLASGFGGIALVLAAVGLYGALAAAVARRTREIGVRLALGAQRGSVLRLVLRESLALVAAGLLVGVPLSLAAGALLRGFLFGVTPYDIPTLIASAGVLAAAALIAASVPARRASRVDPIVALKYE